MLVIKWRRTYEREIEDAEANGIKWALEMMRLHERTERALEALVKRDEEFLRKLQEKYD